MMLYYTNQVIFHAVISDFNFFFFISIYKTVIRNSPSILNISFELIFHVDISSFVSLYGFTDDCPCMASLFIEL